MEWKDSVVLSLPPVQTLRTILAIMLSVALPCSASAQTAQHIRILDSERRAHEEIGFHPSSNGRHVSFETAAAMAVQHAVDRELGERTSGSVVY
jgi:hypothetical protein